MLRKPICYQQLTQFCRRVKRTYSKKEPTISRETSATNARVSEKSHASDADEPIVGLVNAIVDRQNPEDSFSGFGFDKQQGNAQSDDSTINEPLAVISSPDIRSNVPQTSQPTPFSDDPPMLLSRLATSHNLQNATVPNDGVIATSDKACMSTTESIIQPLSVKNKKDIIPSSPILPSQKDITHYFKKKPIISGLPTPVCSDEIEPDNVDSAVVSSPPTRTRGRRRLRMSRPPPLDERGSSGAYSSDNDRHLPQSGGRSTASKNRTNTTLSQTQLALGQTSFITCQSCKFYYNSALPTDRAAHTKFHNDHERGPRLDDFIRGKTIDTLWGPRLNNDGTVESVIIVHHKSPAIIQEYGQQVLTLADQYMHTMESPLIMTWSSKSRLYLHIKSGYVVALIAAHKISRAVPIFCTGSSEQELMAGGNEVDACIGVNKIWVHPRLQRTHLATRLLDEVRINFPSDLSRERPCVRRTDIAFTQPTEEGREFAIAYAKTREGESRKGAFAHPRFRYLQYDEEHPNGSRRSGM